MKRFLKILGVLLLLFVLVIVALPIILKGPIVERTKLELNQQLRAEVDFADIDLSLLSTFPQLTMAIEDLSITGKERFAGLALLRCERAQLDLNLWSVLFGKDLAIEALAFDQLALQVLIEEDGSANYDIFPDSEGDSAVADPGTESEFRLALQSYRFSNMSLHYLDKEGNMELRLVGLDHHGQGDFTAEDLRLVTKTEIAALDFSMDGMSYLSRVRVKGDNEIELNQPDFRFRFTDNKIFLNELGLRFDGVVAMPAEDVEMDFGFESIDGDFKKLLSLIPALYQQDFEALKASGEFEINGKLNGLYSSSPERYPSYDIRLNARNGSFHYPELPASVERINIDFNLRNPSDQLDDLELNLSRFEAQIAGAPLQASMLLRRPISNPDFSFTLRGEMDIAEALSVLPQQGYRGEGRLTADLFASGTSFDLENENYDQVDARGSFRVEGLKLSGDSVAMALSIPSGSLSISPQRAELSDFRLLLGESDFKANGSLDNLLNYALNDKALRGALDLHSNYINYNELSAMMGEEESAPASDSVPETELVAPRLPQNLALGFGMTIDSLLYEDMMIADLRGSLNLQEGRASFEDLGMALLGGYAMADGFYDSKPANPLFEADFKIRDFDCQQSFEKLSMVQKWAPILGSSQGSYSTSLRFTSPLGADLSPQLEQLEASGMLQSSALVLSGKAMARWATAINNPRYQSLQLQPVNLFFAIKEGRLEIDPFDFKIFNFPAQAEGSSGLDQSLDFRINTQIPASEITGGALAKQLGAFRDQLIPLQVKIGGSLTEPELGLSLGDLGKNLKQQLGQEAQKLLEGQSREARAKVEAERQALLAKAEAEGERLVKEAREKAALIRSEAGRKAQQIRSEGDKAAQKILAEAGSNPLKKAAAERLAQETRNTANKQARNLENEADSQARRLEEEAAKKKEQILKEAREKSAL